MNVRERSRGRRARGFGGVRETILLTGVNTFRVAAPSALESRLAMTASPVTACRHLPIRAWFGCLAGAVLALVSLAGRPAAADPAATVDGYGRWVIAADYSRDGKLLVTAGGDSLLYRPGDVIAWNVADGSRIGDFAGHPTAVWSVKLSDDGTLAATSGYDGLVKIWDVASRTAKHDLAKHKGWVRQVAFSPDGSRLASAGEDGTVIVWDTATGAEVKAITAHAGAATCVAFSRDAKTLATGGSDKLVKLWDPATGDEKGRLEGHGDAVWAVGYSPDGATLASAGADRTVRLWQASDAKTSATLTGHADWVTSLGFSPDGTRLATGGIDGSLKLWDVAAKGEQEGPGNLKSSVWTVSFAPDGKTIFAGTHSGCRLVPVPAPKLLPPPPPPPAPPPAPASADGVTPLVPTDFKSMAGATATIASDGTVTVGGPLAKDTYTLKATIPAGVRATALRLEALTDPALPHQGPGRSGNGNFVLTSFAVLVGAPTGADGPRAVAFRGADADFAQDHYPAAAAIDDKPDTGWAISGGIGKPHTVTFTLAEGTSLEPGAPVTITLDHQYADGQHALGKFKLSVVHDKAAPADKPANTP
jgi:hypothetical protein